MAAFEATHDAHAEKGVWLEMDTQLTGDGKLIVLHDDDLNEAVNGNPGWSPGCARPVIEMDWTEVQACDPDVPLLGDVISAAKDGGWRLMIEIKNIPNEANFDPPAINVATALITLLDGEGFTGPDRLIVQSFWPPSLHVAETQATMAGFALRSMLLTTSSLAPAPSPAGFPALSNALYTALGQIDIVAPDVRSLDLNATTVAAIQALGKEVIIWTANDSDTLATAAEWGVDDIITDHPGAAYEVLAQ